MIILDILVSNPANATVLHVYCSFKLRQPLRNWYWLILYISFTLEVIKLHSKLEYLFLIVSESLIDLEVSCHTSKAAIDRVFKLANFEFNVR